MRSFIKICLICINRLKEIFQRTIEEISIFSNSSHIEWRAGLSETILKGTHPARFGIIWFSGFRGEDLNVIFYQNMPNLHNRYKSVEFPCSCSKNLSSFRFIIKQQEN